MRTRRYSLVIAIALAASLLAVVQVDVPKTLGGLKGDEATYVSMALSLARDRDLKFTRTDLERFTGLYGSGPEGLFLKQGRRVSLRWSGLRPRIVRQTRPPAEGLDYGKALLFPLAAAPFVFVFGLNGLLVLNVLLVAAVTWAGMRYAAAHGRAGGVLFAVAFVFASIAPVYVFWLTPEILNFSFVFLAYALWLYKRTPAPTGPTWIFTGWSDVVAALLLGCATFSKPPNALLIVPLGIDALRRRRLGSAVALSLAFLAGSAGLFAINGVISGDLNYQGGERKTFYGRFPYSDADATFASTGTAMATDQSDAEDLLAPHVLWPLLRRNVVYFVLGRDAGLVPYFFPGVLAVIAWLSRRPRFDTARVSIAAALGASVIVLLVLTPFSWGGGGGPPGNRYFLSLYPALFFLAPPLTINVALVAWTGGMFFVAPWLLTPVAASKTPWTAVDTPALRLLPIELTMVDDLPVRLSAVRGRIPFGGGPQVLLYFMDDRASPPEGHGVWVHAGGTAEIIVRSEQPLNRLKITWTTTVRNRVRASIAGHSVDMTIEPGQSITSVLPVGPGVTYVRGTQAYVLRLSAEDGVVPALQDPHSADMRLLGAFADLRFE